MSGALRDRPVTIVGAGVAGLTAAIALARRDARVTVLERAPAIRELGAGLQLSPNAMRVIDALGLGEALRGISLRSNAVQLRDTSGAQVAKLDLLRHRPDDDFRLVHRARLIELLAASARSAGVEIRLSQEVATPPEGGLIIGADGLRSAIRTALNGREVPFFTHQTAWRAVIPDATGAPPEAQVFMGPGRHLVSYPLVGGLRNLVAVQERHEWQEEGWSHEDDPDHLRRAFAAFGGPVPEWLDAVTETHIWGLFRHDVARRWQDGRCVLIGDAAHPTLPFMAQGAAMAIEDAWILAACLDAGPDQPTALNRFDSLRRSRVEGIVAAANANARNYHLTGPLRFAAHTALRLAHRFAPGHLLGRFDWLYDYDSVAITF
ncbi:FAD-dependent oxidoreductase [Paracoccus saliphilus]|uniref:FAD-dependent monooxygenase n=1 Tax=Paracoccus saliphilus TaxID=405559 RepID=A0AA45W2D4_9RHOB|nr:FAD-dependent oxidoreductase [Paracoccus saliphilus]WCR01955.1 FAD-dependent monooxygenase [Paracoccus saliphilus]SIS65698.1 salicylate hydroxylase [Paracoccus saliphilus]